MLTHKNEYFKVRPNPYTYNKFYTEAFCRQNVTVTRQILIMPQWKRHYLHKICLNIIIRDTYYVTS